MQCPKCGFQQPDQSLECLSCGIVFEKYRNQQQARPFPVSPPARHPEDETGSDNIVKALFFYVRPETNLLFFAGRLLFFIILVIWGVNFIFSPRETNAVGMSFWHLVNLPFHEAGHIFFRPLGRFMTSLGGSLAQLLMPLICLAVFLVKTRDTFAAAFALWWLGESFMDLAPYIDDARSLSLPLVGGNFGHSSPYGFHDWEFILKESGLIRYDHALAGLSHKTGTLLMLMAFAWGGYILFKQYRNLQLGEQSKPAQ